VYNLKLVLLLVGDNKGTIIRGVWVEFNDIIMEAYKVFLRRCYDMSLKWAYNLDDEEEHATLQAMKSLLPVSIDFESFEDYYHLWKQSTSTSDSRLPLPPTKYIIPYHFAKWNKFKGGSDTLTKHFWNSNHYVPSGTPAAYAVSRLIRFLAAMLYRCEAIMTSKEDLNFYTSLLHWRHANNTRLTSFNKFLRCVSSSYFTNTHEPTRPVTPPREPTIRASRSRVPQYEAVWACDATGKTPKRNVQKQYSEATNVDSNVLERRDKCPGHIAFRVRIDENGKETTTGKGTMNKCSICDSNTRYYCTFCRHWYCGPTSYFVGKDGKNSVAFVEDPDADNGRIWFRRSCWHGGHEKGLALSKFMLKDD